MNNMNTHNKRVVARGFYCLGRRRRVVFDSVFRLFDPRTIHDFPTRWFASYYITHIFVFMIIQK